MLKYNNSIYLNRIYLLYGVIQYLSIVISAA